MRGIRIATIAAALLATPFAGTASAETCSPAVGPITCATKADARILGVVGWDSCMWVGPGGWDVNCWASWNVSWSGESLTPGVVTTAIDGYQATPTCDWTTGGCGGTATLRGFVAAQFRGTTCAPATVTATFSATATSTFGQATDSTTGTGTLYDPRNICA